MHPTLRKGLLFYNPPIFHFFYKTPSPPMGLSPSAFLAWTAYGYECINHTMNVSPSIANLITFIIRCVNFRPPTIHQINHHDTVIWPRFRS